MLKSLKAKNLSEFYLWLGTFIKLWENYSNSLIFYDVWCCIYNCSYYKRALWMLALHVFGEATEQRDCSRTSKYRTSWTKFLQTNTHKFVINYWRGSKYLKDHVKYEILNLVNEEGSNIKWGEFWRKYQTFVKELHLNDWTMIVKR